MALQFCNGKTIIIRNVYKPLSALLTAQKTDVAQALVGVSRALRLQLHTPEPRGRYGFAQGLIRFVALWRFRELGHSFFIRWLATRRMYKLVWYLSATYNSLEKPFN